MQTDHISLLDDDMVLLDNRHQDIVADMGMRIAEMGVKIDHHRPALDAMRGHVLDPEARASMCFPASCRADPGVIDRVRTDDVRAGAKAVVEDVLEFAVTIHIELSAHMSERIPLGRILQMQDCQVVAKNVRRSAVGAKGRVEIDLAFAQGRPQDRRLAARGFKSLPPG